LRAYLRNGVREYIIWRVYDRAIDQFVLREGRYDLVPSAADGILRSEQFPGFWLDTAAIIRGDVAGVISFLQKGLASPEHAVFAERLATSKA
jgi:hypothetical protein